MSSFSQLGIGDALVSTLDSLSITTPTEIQEQAIPILLSKDTDMVALSQTGSGKTLAFGLPILEKTDVNLKSTQHLVVAPTRELAIQVAQQLINVSAKLGKLSAKAIFGGTPVDPQVRDLKRNVPHVLVATPGRLIDMLERGAVKLDNIKTVVLDEADEMLNMGFKEDIYRILEFTAKNRQLWMFSATMAKEIRAIADGFMTDPVSISINASEKVNRNIEHKYTLVKRNQKSQALERFFDFYPEMYALVFCRTRMGTQNLSDELNARGYLTEALHGDMSQGQREKVMRRFRAKQIRVLCATDVAARGIDVDDLTHVFHHALPDDNAFYTHRSGRTARAGKKGESFVIISNSEERKLKMLARALQIDFEKVDVPSLGHVRELRLQRWAKSIAEIDAKKGEIGENELDIVFQEFKGISKEELIEKLLNKEFGGHKKGQKDDIADTARGSERIDGKSSKPKSSGRDGYVTFAMNVGREDSVTKRDLAEFIVSEARIDKNSIGDIHIDKRKCTFQISKKAEKAVAEGFKNLSVNGRELKVFVSDEEIVKKDSGRGDFKKKFKPKEKGFKDKPYKKKKY